MRRRLHDDDPGTLAAAPVTVAASLAQFGRRHGFPLIVKPVDGSASLGVQLVGGPADLDGAWAAVQEMCASSDHKFAEFFPADRFIVEQYAGGREYSVEALSFDGRHVVVTITEKVTLPGFVELGHALPARLDAVDERVIADEVTRFLDVMGVCHGATHTEVKVAERRAHIIESHTRTGGDSIVELVDHAYGIDLETYAIAWSAGLWPDSRAPRGRSPRRRRASSSPSRGRRRRQGLEQARAMPGVLEATVSVAVGDTVGRLRASWDRVGQVIAGGADTQRAIARCEEAAACIQVVTQPATREDAVDRARQAAAGRA